MTKRQRKLMEKNTMRDTMTGKRINGNKEVILLENALDYVKKLGYIVLRPKTVENLKMGMTMVIIFCFLFFSMSLSSALITVSPNYTGGTYPDLIIKNNANTILTLRLLENTDKCLINCYAIINVTNYISGALPNSFDAVDKKGNLKSLDYKLYFLNNTYNNVTLNHYIENCSGTPINPATYICTKTNDYNYTEIKKTQNWVLYTGQTFLPNNWTLKLEVVKNPLDSLDWGFSYNTLLSDEIRNYWAWFNSSWSYTKQVYFNTTDVASRNSTYFVNVSYVSGKMMSNFSDLRFTLTDNSTELGYWFYNNTWVENGSVMVAINLMALNISSSANATINMWYGNPNAVTNSNISKAFMFGDDFYDINWNKWSSASQGSYTVSGGLLSATPTSSRIISNQLFANGFETVLRAKSSVTTGIPAFAFYDLSSSTYQTIHTYNGAGSIYLGGEPRLVGNAVSDNTFYLLKYLNNATGNDNATIGSDSILPRGNIQSVTGAGGTRSGNISFVQYSAGTGTVDWIYVRPYVFIEPTVTFGTEGNSPVQSATINFNFISQSPNDLTSSNVVANNLFLVYNITTTSSNATINITTAKAYLRTNSTTLDNPFYINGTQRVIGSDGFYEDSSIPNNVTGLYNFTIDDNSIYPATYNFNQNAMEITPHLVLTTGNNGVIKIILLNVSNSTQYNFFEIMTNKTGTGTAETYYYCNETYINGNPSTNNNCYPYGTLAPTGSYSHSESVYTQHQVIPLSIVNGSVGTVKVTSVSKFVIAGDTWNFFYISNNSRLGANQVSNNNGVTYTNQTYTFDAHLHQFSNYTFFYYVCANDTVNIRNCSSVRSDNIQLDLLNPTSPVVLTPVSGTYSDFINVTYIASVSPNGYAISYYNITLLNSDMTFNKTLTVNNGLNLSYSFNSTALFINDSSYYIKVTVTDANNLSNYGLSQLFTIKNTQSPVVIKKDVLFSLDMSTTQGILIFIILLVLSVLILIYINYSLGVVFLFMCGILSLVSLSNKLLAVIIIIASVSLAFRKER